MEKNKMGYMPVPKLLTTMALPLIVSMLIQALYNIIDSVFVAQINENALAAVSLAFPAQNLLIAFGVGTGLGINAFLSRSLGEKKYDQVNDIANHAIFLWAVTSAVFAILGFTLAEPFFRMQTDDPQIIEYGTAYFRICVGLSVGLFGQFTFERLMQATGRSFESMVTQAVGALINIVADPIFIFVFDMDVAGAAYATVLGQILSCMLGIYINHKKNHDVKICLRGFRPKFTIIKQIYQIALPAIVMQSMTSLMNFGMNLILIGFSSTATAVFGVYYKLQSFFFMPLYGTNNALVPIVAFNFGAKEKSRMMHAIRLAMQFSLVLMITGTAVFLALPGPLLQMFNAEEHMLAIGIPALRIIGLNFPFAGICVVCGSVFQAVNKAGYSLLTSLIRQMIVLLPMAFLLSLSGQLTMVWWAFLIAEAVGFAVSLILMKRLSKKLDFES